MAALENNVYRKVLDDFEYELIIAHKIEATGSIGEQVVSGILSADLVIVNLTGLNANVLYETAIAHSFGIPCVMICEKTTNLPFDLISERTLFYSDSIEGCGDLIHQLSNKINHLIKDGNFDNPVYRVLERNAAKNIKVDESLPTNLLFDIEDQIRELTKNINTHINTDSGWTSAPSVVRKNIRKRPDITINTPNGPIKVYNSDSISDEEFEKFTKDIYDLSCELDKRPSLTEIEKKSGIPRVVLKNMIVY